MSELLVRVGHFKATLAEGEVVEVYDDRDPAVRLQLRSTEDFLALQSLATALITPHFNPKIKA